MSSDMRNGFPLIRLIEVSGGDATFPVEGEVVNRIISDSRKVVPGDLFVAVDGGTVNGHVFVPEALERGAVAAVVEREADPEAKLIVVPDTRIALAEMAKEFYGKPDEALKLAGITGTNGKTTSTYMVKSIAEANGLVFGAIGTLGYYIGGTKHKLDFTTPDPTALFGIMAEMVSEGLAGASMEVSSHGLAQRRSWGIDYDVVAFTNLTQDHLDFHGNMENYFAIKSELFEQVKPSASSVINIDDEYGKRLVEISASESVLTYGLRQDACLRALNIEHGTQFTNFDFYSPIGNRQVTLGIPGEFNVYNALNAAGIAIALGWSLDSIIVGLESFRGVPGRLESVDRGQPFAVYVDYSHTPDALANAIRSCRKIAEGRVIVVFGCGGNRDRGKRPKMGRVAGENADIVVLTSDNPRMELPSEIIDEIESGVPGGSCKYRIDERREAIEFALGLAKSGDVVLIAGKGHEDYQIIGTEIRPFDDRKIATEWLEEKGYREKS